MAIFVHRAATDAITVREQDRKLGFIRNDGRGEFGHHIGAVEVIGDFAKAFGLALGKEITVALV